MTKKIIYYIQRYKQFKRVFTSVRRTRRPWRKVSEFRRRRDLTGVHHLKGDDSVNGFKAADDMKPQLKS